MRQKVLKIIRKNIYKHPKKTTRRQSFEYPKEITHLPFSHTYVFNVNQTHTHTHTKIIQTHKRKCTKDMSVLKIEQKTFTMC